MKDLEKTRVQIEEIDAKLAELFEQRMKLSEDVAGYKKEAGLPVKDVNREDALIEKNRNYIKDTELQGYYVEFMNSILNISCKYQTKLLSGMKVAFSGEKGAFAYIAAKRMYPSAELIAFPDFHSAYKAAENGEVDCAVLPIENSYSGEVGTVMDLLFSGSLSINQVVDVPISHCIVANSGATLESVKTVISHPQALDQCGEYIRDNKLQEEGYSNTALAAQHVKESGRTDIAAIASADTAEVFGMKILERNIQDNKSNTTRFAAFSRIRNKVPASKTGFTENFILVFTVRNEAGALAQALDIIGSHGFNMRSLRSRPMKELSWSYFFYIEAEGNINTKNGDNMLKELSAVCDKLKLAGAYMAENVNR